jgi:hypothetical protein
MSFRSLQHTVAHGMILSHTPCPPHTLPLVCNTAHHPRQPQGLLHFYLYIVLSYPSTQIEVFCEAVPKTAQVHFLPSCPYHTSYPSFKNFLALCASNYYDGCLFHRNIKGFMIQTGDPTDTGKGGQSIWGKPFPDEIRSTLKVTHCSTSILRFGRSALMIASLVFLASMLTHFR